MKILSLFVYLFFLKLSVYAIQNPFSSNLLELYFKELSYHID